MVQTNGWKNEQIDFVLGYRMFTESGVEQVIQPNSEEAEGLTRKGSLEEWVAAVKDVISDPIVRFKCYCMATAPLLKLLNVQSFFVDHFGETSTGKTFGFKVAVSMYGDPLGLKFAGHSTTNFLQTVAHRYTDMPLFVDETSIQNPDVLTDLIYMVTNEVDKGRAKKEGGVQRVNHWKTVTFTTGEKPIVNYGGYGGQQVRVIEIQKEMPYMHDQIVEADEAIKNNHGHVIGLLIWKFLQRQNELKNKYKVYRKMFTDSDSRTENRMGSNFAAIALAGEILEKVFAEIGIEPQDNLELTMSFFNETVKDKPVEPYAVKVLRHLDGWYEENRNFFVNAEDLVNIQAQQNEQTKIYGYIQDNYIDIIPKVAKDALKDYGFSAVIEKWIELGVFITNTHRNDYRVPYEDENGIRPTVYRINLDEMKKILSKEIK